MRVAVVAAVATAGLACSVVTAAAQRSQGVVTTEEFEAKAAQRKRRTTAPLNLPDFGPGDGASRAPMFVLKSVAFSGNHAVRREDIVNLSARYIGKSVSQRDLAELSAAITGLYRERGFALSRAFVPPQDIEDGRLQIRIVEGSIEETRIDGLGADWALARDILDGVRGERPTRLATLERAMLLLADLPGIRIKDAALTEIGTGSGRFRLVVKAEFVRVGAHLEFDNRGSHDIGPWQNFSSAWFNSVLTRGDTLIVNGSTIPNSPRQLAYVGAIYDRPLGASGLRGGFRASYSQGWPDGWQGIVDTRTHMQDYAAYLSFAALRTREASLRLTTTLGVRNADESDNTGPSYTDHVRTLSVSAEAQLNDQMRGSTYLTVTARHGLSALGNSARDDASSRPDAPGDFSKLSFVASRYQSIAGPFSLLIAGAGQVSSGPLLKSESFFFGGFQFGRAFAPGAIYGDAGIAGLLELRFDQSLDLALTKGYQIYGFVDRGAIWTRGLDFQGLSSAGGGVRVFLNDDLRAGFEIATPLETAPGLERETRFYVSLARTFRGCELASCP